MTSPPAPQAAQPADRIRHSLTLITLIRCVYGLLVLAYSAIWLNARTGSLIGEIQTTILLYCITEIFFFTAICSIILWRGRFIRGITYISMVHDAMIAGIMVLLTGYENSLFLYLFLIIPLYGGIILKKRGGLIGAGITTFVMAGFFLFLPRFGDRMPNNILFMLHDADVLRPGLLWLPFWSLTLISFGVGLLTGQLASQYANTQARLLKTDREFARLRDIHAYLLDALPVGITMVRPDTGTLLFANPWAHKLLGSHLTAPDFTARIAKHQPDETATWVVNFEQKSLRVGRFELSIDANNRLQGYHMTDITAICEAQKQLDKRRRLELLGEFSARIAHEIRNPLACISGCSEMLEIDANSPEQHEILNMIHTEIQRLDSLLKDILLFSRPPKLHLTATPILELIEKQKQIFMGDPACRNLSLVIQTDLDAAEYRTDPAVLAQILMTLWRNAQEATQSQGRIDTRVTLSKGKLRITVADNGPGIDADVESHIFEPFFTTKPNGTGLGLATARQLAHEIGFELNLKPHETGSCFELLTTEGRT